MAEDLKDSGNEFFKMDKFEASIDAYTKALEHQADDKLRLVLYKNRAMARLKVEDFEGAESDCDKALEINQSDPKAYYRRALAREKLGKLGTAFTDAKEALRLLPGDRPLIELCNRLVKANTEKMQQVESIEGRVNEMMKLSFEETQKDEDKNVKALNNLLVLCRESNEGASRVWRDGAIVAQLLSLIKNQQQEGGAGDETALCAVRILAELTKFRERAVKVMELLGGASALTRLPTLRQSTAYVEAASTIIQHMFNALAAMDRSKDTKPDTEITERNKLPIVRIILELEEMLTDPQYSVSIREMAIDLLMKNLMHMDGGLPRGWSWRFVEDRGLFKMLHIATQIPEQCDYPVSAETRLHVAIFLTRLYDDMVFDQRRALYTERVKQVFEGLISDIGDRKNRVRLAALLITLLQGPVDVGLNLITNDQVTIVMLQMASEEEDRLQQSLAAELIVLSVSKYERATALIKQGLPVLKKLYQSEDPNVRVRALVGLCKCASSAGDDCSRQPMDDESRMKLAAACRKYLIEKAHKYSVDVRRFACEGLSYLSLDAEIKEYIVGDLDLLKGLVELAKNAGALCVYTMATIFTNCSNAYDRPKVDEELVKLAQFAKHHVPETHPKDTDEFVEKRIRRMVEAGAVTACVSVSKTESRNALDNLALCMRAFCAVDDLTGQIISQGGARLLLHLYKECSADGKLKAAHGLARLGTRSDPNIAFPGQRMYEVVKPMVELLHPDVDGRANYDALLTLTNLASVNDSVRKHILKERALPKIEEFWFETGQEDLRAAAAELLLNLLFCEEYFKEVLKPGTDKAKVWLLYCDEGNDRLKLASSAGFAILSEDQQFCERILKELSNWPELFKNLAMAENAEVQRRCLIGIANMVEFGGEAVASQIMASEIFRVLVAITKLGNNDREAAQKEAQRALDSAEKQGLIRKTERQLYEQKTKLSTVPENP